MRHYRILVIQKNGYPHRVGRPMGDITDATREWRDAHPDKTVIRLTCENDPGDTWIDSVKDIDFGPRPRARIGVATTRGTAWRVVIYEPCQGGVRIAHTHQWGCADRDTAHDSARAWRKKWPSAKRLLREMDDAVRENAQRLAPPRGAA